MCGRRDLNPYPLPDTPLKRARMPIPPRPQTNMENYKAELSLCQDERKNLRGKEERSKISLSEGKEDAKMRKKTVILSFLFIVFASVLFVYPSGYSDEAFQIRRVGNINPYADNAFRIRTSEDGIVTIRIHDSICVYRIITDHITAGETTIHWDGCGYNQEKLYEKTYTVTAEFIADSGLFYSVSFASPIEYPAQFLQYALPSSDCAYLDSPTEWFLEYRAVTDGNVRIEMYTSLRDNPVYSWTLPVSGGKIARKDLTDIAGKKKPEPGQYTVLVYEVSRPDHQYEFPLNVLDHSPERTPVTVTGGIMPDRTMSETEIWDIMMRPSVVVDIDFFSHQQIYTEPDDQSDSLGTLHGQTQCLEVLQIKKDWALVGAWNHEEAEYVEGWVPLSKLKTESPKSEYGILIDKQKQTLSVFREGKIIDTLLISTGRAERKSLYQETSAGSFLTGYHRVNFSMNGKKYDYVIQYDGGNLLHQTPYDWGQHKKDFTLGRGYLGTKASHACIRIQPEPGDGGLNAYWLFTHLPYHTRIIILDDPEERTAAVNKLKRSEKDSINPAVIHTVCTGSGNDNCVNLTFGGCLLPGGSRAFNKRSDSFASYAVKAGYEHVLASLKPIFEEDDLTCVNLCIPIQDSPESAPDGKGTSFAPDGMEKIFLNASVEMVQLTDDRIYRSGPEPAEHTAGAIAQYAVVLDRNNTVSVELKGHLFGFAGCSESEYLKNPSVIDERIGVLKEKQCERIILLSSWGEDKSTTHSIVQEAMAHRGIRAGADLVVGNHQGIIQGIDYMEGVPVVYSLGDLLNGSTGNKPKAQQGMLIRAVFDFSSGSESLSLDAIPLLPYGNTRKDRNDFTPAIHLEEEERLQIIHCVWQDTADQVLEKIRFRLTIQ